MNIRIICVGKLKERFYREAVEEYVKRLGAYAKIEIAEVADEKTPDGASEVVCEKIKDKEGERILGKLHDQDYCIALAINGKARDSVAFSEHLSDLMQSGKSSFAFVIGGSLGLSDAVLARANEQISFSKMTFPHQLMRVILTEQLYRAFRIMNGQPYHK
ncbi:MAG: 23S rRNA (pseudouridine(1915)-N(3))-methyltransferase RlmH [Lachnospiraceae bacterium]|nr:23S rRNA (pseudouridine(1915)-N(3))-methyltransferase RlmH [Lachnospiraceae bacterium]